jgi:hypothetical protein
MPLAPLPTASRWKLFFRWWFSNVVSNQNGSIDFPGGQVETAVARGVLKVRRVEPVLHRISGALSIVITLPLNRALFIS